MEDKQCTRTQYNASLDAIGLYVKSRLELNIFQSSNLKLILQLPVSKVTSCAFGGSNLNELYITTASIGLNDIEAERQPHAGKIFKFITQEQGYASNCYRSENISNLYH